MSGEGPCHSGIGLVTLKLDLRPSFIFNDKLYLFLDLDVGRWGLRSSIGLFEINSPQLFEINRGSMRSTIRASPTAIQVLSFYPPTELLE